MLVLSPHTDDAELSCGGTIMKMIKKGYQVTVIVFSNCENSLIENDMDPCTLLNENVDSLEVLGVQHTIYLDYENRKLFEKRAEILNYLHVYSKSHEVEYVFIPQPNDVHQDHQTVAEEAIRAFRRTNAKIFGYEIIGTSNFDPNYYIPLTIKEVERKIMALECYKSQKILRPYFQPDIVKSMAIMRGAAVNERYAEAFTLIKGRFEI